MKLSNPSNYAFVRFEPSLTKGKKYDAVLVNKKTGGVKRVPFGAKTYEQYKDSTGLGLYSHLNHLDKKRRERYRARHSGEDKSKFSSGWFSWKFLW